MKKLSLNRQLLVSLALALGVMGSANSQEIASITANAKEVTLGSDVDLSLSLKPNPNGANNCALLVEFGNGDSEYVRVTSSNPADLQVPVKVKYASAGTYTVTAKGKLMIRGLNTLGPCEGEKSETVSVVTPPPPPAPVQEPAKNQKKRK
jgi:hypothetical protein